MFGSQIPKFFYYSNILTQLSHRKPIIRDSKKLQRKLKRSAFPPLLRWERTLVNNPKKILAGFIFLGVLQYYGIYRWVWDYARYMEPMRFKLRRLLLAENNKPLPTHIEQNYFSLGDKLQPITIQALESVFTIAESSLQLGVNRKYLYKIYDQLGVFQKPEERLALYRSTGYYKKRNQRLCSVNVNKFVELFHEAFQKMKKINGSLTEQEFLINFVQAAKDQLPQIIEWENKIQQKRQEYKKLTPHLQEHKEFIIKEMLKEDPYVKFDAIDERLNKNGLGGMSIKDKIIVTHQQISLREVLLDSYRTKLTRFQDTKKSIRIEKKIKLLENDVEKDKQVYENLMEQFRFLFKKQELFPLKLQ